MSKLKGQRVTLQGKWNGVLPALPELGQGTRPESGGEKERGMMAKWKDGIVES